MIKYKASVQLQGLQVQMLIALIQVSDFSRLNNDVVIFVTSALDGSHSAKSLHYAGAALDLDIPGPPELNQALAAHLSTSLPLDYDVVNEGSHVHIEWQPRHRARGS